MDMPPLSDAEREALVESIRQDGVRYPVLVDATGSIIDGNNRLAITAELGVECPKIVLDVDSATADRLRLSLQLARRNLSAKDRKLLVIELRAQGRSTRQIAEQLGVDPKTVRRDLDGATGAIAPVDPLPDTVVGKDNKVRAASRTPRDRSKQKAIAERKQAAAERSKKQRQQAQRINGTNAGHLRAAAANAPNGKLNLPALRDARRVRQGLLDLSNLLPAERFVSQLPIEACREFSEDTVLWWQDVCRLAAERLALEGADLPPLSEVRVNGGVDSAVQR